MVGRGSGHWYLGHARLERNPCFFWRRRTLETRFARVNQTAVYRVLGQRKYGAGQDAWCLKTLELFGTGNVTGRGEYVLAVCVQNSIICAVAQSVGTC